MAPKKKIKRKVVSSKKKKNKITKKSINNFNYNNVYNFIKMVVKSPFLFINQLIKILTIATREFFLHFSKITKHLFSSFSSAREAFFSVLFGLLSGGIGAVLVLSYLDISNDYQKSEMDANRNKQEEILSEINKKISVAEDKLNEYNALINEISRNIEVIDENIKNNFIIYGTNIEGLKSKYSDIDEQVENLKKNTKKQVANLENKIDQTSKLMLSSSKSELSNRLYLAQSLVDRLKSGVPYAPQLVALGKEGLDPALLRFAKGGAPTLTDLTARLSVRAGELRDAYKTKSDTTWKDNLKNEISKLVTIKPTDSSDIKGMEGVLLRAEEAISKGDLKSAILEIDTLDQNARGALDAWLLEAKAKQNASIAAENLLAKTTAALRKRN